MRSPNVLKQALIDKAKRLHGDNIMPANNWPVDMCFTKVDNRLLFWYNDSCDSTHIVIEELSEVSIKKSLFVLSGLRKALFDGIIGATTYHSYSSRIIDELVSEISLAD